MRKYLVALTALTASGLWMGHVLPASASTITYNLIPNSSDIVVTGTISGGGFTNATLDFSGATAWKLNLTSGSMTLDSSAPALDAFSFGTANAGTKTISIGGVSTLGTLSLTNVLIGSTANPDAPLTGNNPYGLSTGNVMDDANYSFVPVAGSTQAGMFSNTGAPITGTLVTGGATPLWFAQSNAVQLGTGTFSLAGSTYTVSLKGDINFEGASPVPLPASAWLLVGGLGVLGITGARRRRAGDLKVTHG